MAEPTLTRASEVLDVLRAGGFVLANVSKVGFGLYDLYDTSGKYVPAWQQAIKSTLSKLHKSFEVSHPSAGLARWDLRK